MEDIPDDENVVNAFTADGSLLQIEYAKQVVRMGSATVGLKNKNSAVLLAIKTVDRLRFSPEKIISLDAHVGVAYTGLQSDATVLSEHLRTECRHHRNAHKEALPVNELITKLVVKIQEMTQRHDRRPYGVGFLIAGFDASGPKIYEMCPSGDHTYCNAVSIGKRSNLARTYLENNLNSFVTSDTVQELVRQGLLALRECLSSEREQLNSTNISIGIVRNGQFNICDEESVEQFLALLSDAEKRGRQSNIARARASRSTAAATTTTT